MLFIKSALTISALVGLASALTMERVGKIRAVSGWEGGRWVPAHEQASILEANVEAHGYRAPFAISNSECEKEDADDCTEFCGASEQTATCSANGNKVTCSCKGGKAPGGGTNCEERCLLCMPDKSAFEEASRAFGL
ncbi:hypothetical protein LHYA1_G001056 [Lachnellula hyalina]|uniref:EGF-like domain-containing protein n=1 Tax=Lachnellula hyalina TaxID=1316788 RepID=A0A8H8RA25_9HELO|nr:uncharacterized protein LHYA1_G001056 [Lachnellula hyalina]TVY29570.1 hypothetical protein LHYA1_G001056 [Lachnellula hyalina]